LYTRIFIANNLVAKNYTKIAKKKSCSHKKRNKKYEISSYKTDYSIKHYDINQIFKDNPIIQNIGNHAYRFGIYIALKFSVFKLD